MTRKDLFTTIETINIWTAKRLAESIIHCTKFDGKEDIVVAVLGADGRILCLEKSGNNPLPISDSWAFKKARTALAFGASTKKLYMEKPNLNVGSEYCKTPGGILIPSSKWSGWLDNSSEEISEDGEIAPFSGAIGVSGRSSKEDHILAVSGLKDFIKLLKRE